MRLCGPKTDRRLRNDLDAVETAILYNRNHGVSDRLD